MERGRIDNLKLVIVTVFLIFPIQVSATLDVAEVLDAYPEFSLLNQLLNLTGLAGEINSGTGFTLFAPPNDILANFQADITNSVMGDILRHHVATQYLDFTELQMLTTDLSVPTLLRAGNIVDPDVVIISNNALGTVINNTINTNLVRSVTQLVKDISIIKIDQVLRPAGYPSLPPTSSQFLNPLNVTRTLGTLADFSIFKAYLEETGVDLLFDGRQQSKAGCTIFIPTDEAFNSLPGDWFQKFSKNDQRLFLEYHSLSRFFSLGDLWKLTQISAETVASTLTNGGPYILHMNSSKGNVNIRAGKSEAMITATLYQSDPVILFAIDAVLLPRELFGDDYAFSPSSNPPLGSPDSSESPAAPPPPPTPYAARGPHQTTPSTAPAPENSRGGKSTHTGIVSFITLVASLLLSSSLCLWAS